MVLVNHMKEDYFTCITDKDRSYLDIGEVSRERVTGIYDGARWYCGYGEASWIQQHNVALFVIIKVCILEPGSFSRSLIINNYNYQKMSRRIIVDIILT